MRTSLPADPAFRRRLALAGLIAAALNFIAFYPGLLHHDAWAYFDAAKKFEFTNWQPPLLAYLWVPLQKIWYGPQPMFVLFTAAYWSGFVLYADALKHEGRALAAWTLAAALFPMLLNFNGQLVKDIAMANCLLVAAGIAAGLITGTIRTQRIAVPLMWLFLALGAFMRVNSLFALPPLLDMLLRATSKRWAATGFLRRAIIVCLLSLAVIPAHFLADRYVYRVKDLKPLSQLQIFDIGGISYFSGQDYFKGEFGPEFAARNKTTCYTPRYWDAYGFHTCPEVYERLKPKFGGPLTTLWLDAIRSEPLAYIQHRLAHLNRFMQFFCKDCKEVVFTGAQSSNQKEFTYEPGYIYKAIEWFAETQNNSPLGPPYVWLLIALAWAWAALAIPNERTRYLTVMLALSGAMYALGFGAVGIAHEYRYIFWTMLCALAATPAVVARVLLRSDAPLSYRLFPLFMIAGVILLREAVVGFIL